MRGQSPLIAMRQRNIRPDTFVSVDVGGGRWMADNWHAEGLQPFVLVEPDDAPARLDLRFLVGLVVHVSGMEWDSARVYAVREACSRAGAARVLGGLCRLNGHGVIESVEGFDSEGILVWQI